MTSGGNLLHNCVLFGRLLRALGVEVTPTQVVDLAESLHHVDIGRRDDFQNAARAILIGRKEHLALFDAAFELFWRAHSDQGLLELDLNALVKRKPKLEELKQQPDLAGNGGRDLPLEAEPQIERIYTYSDLELLRQKNFAMLDDQELLAIKQLMLQMSWRIEPRRTRRMVAAPHGRWIDLRRTLRQNLRYGGETLQLALRTRKERRRPVVLICDMSGSMERYSRVLLQFIYVVTSRLDRVESFVFSTRLTRITRQLRSRDVDRALDEATAQITDWAGGTRIGDAIKSFNYQWARRVLGQGAVVLIISDGWDRGEIEVLGREMERLHRSCHRLIWLNPLLGDADYQPLVRGIQAALPHVDDFLPVHNLNSLAQLADILADYR
jgi:hypothetical protein